MRLRQKDGILSVGTTARPALSVIWSLTQKVNKRNDKKSQNPIAKWFQKSYNMVTAWAINPAECEIFFFLFLGYRARVLLLRLFSFTAVTHVPHRRYPASCAKKPVLSPDGLFCTLKTAVAPGKYDLTPFWWAFCLFFCKGHLQSLAGQGFVFWPALWYCIYNNL